MNTIDLGLSQQLDDYKIINIINKNHYNRTYIVKSKYAPDSNSELFLLSQFPLLEIQENSVKSHVLKSYQTLGFLSNQTDAEKHMVRCRTFFTDRTQIYFIFDFGSLVPLDPFYSQLIDGIATVPISLTYELQKTICEQLIEGLSWIHQNQATHNNIQLKSVWFDFVRLKASWADFGFQIPNNIIYYSPQLATAVAERDRNRPQKFQAYISNLSQQMANDVWGLGVVMYFLIFGLDNSLDLTFQSEALLATPYVSNSWKSFLTKILNPNIDKRLKMPEVLSEFRSSF
jgi:serine/threonine protein kinase